MLVSEIKKNMLKPVMYRDEKERKARHSVMLREENNSRSFCRAPIEEVEVIENG